MEKKKEETGKKKRGWAYRIGGNGKKGYTFLIFKIIICIYQISSVHYIITGNMCREYKMCQASHRLQGSHSVILFTIHNKTVSHYYEKQTTQRRKLRLRSPNSEHREPESN